MMDSLDTTFYRRGLTNEELRQLAVTQKKIDARHYKLIPTNYSDYRNHPKYVLRSLLKRYQALVPVAKPLPFLFKDEEEIFHR